MYIYNNNIYIYIYIYNTTAVIADFRYATTDDNTTATIIDFTTTNTTVLINTITDDNTTANITDITDYFRQARIKAEIVLINNDNTETTSIIDNANNDCFRQAK